MAHLAGSFQRLDRVDTEFLVEDTGSLGAEPGDSDYLHEAGGDALVEHRQIAPGPL